MKRIRSVGSQFFIEWFWLVENKTSIKIMGVKTETHQS